MSWPRPNKVRLAVTRFKPDDTPIAGLTAAERAALREKRARETKRVPVRPDGQISRDGRFRWSAGWAQWVPTRDEVPIIEPCCSDGQCEICVRIAARLERARLVRERNPYDSLYIKQRRQADGI